jgi:hypothetical protein
MVVSFAVNVALTVLAKNSGLGSSFVLMQIQRQKRLSGEHSSCAAWGSSGSNWKDWALTQVVGWDEEEWEAGSGVIEAFVGQRAVGNKGVLEAAAAVVVTIQADVV